MIIFLPTSFYLFLVEVCNRGNEKRYVLFSYCIASILAISLLSSDLFVSGEYHYFFGYYPKAGVLHPLHVIQSIVIALRCFAITHQKLKQTTERDYARLRVCLISLCIYTFSALDYLCNYGVEFYPPGVVFLVVSFAFFSFGIVRYDLMNPYALAAGIAHEMRSPLVAMKYYSDELALALPALCEAYQASVSGGVYPDAIGAQSLERLKALPDKINQSVRQSNVTIDMFLAVTRELDIDSFENHSITTCIFDALEQFPFTPTERELVRYEGNADFQFRGSNDLMIFVLFNLLKNALWAIKSSRRGEIVISTFKSPKSNVLQFTDTASGIDSNDLPYIFEAFFSTKRKAGGTGVGLSFCQHVVQAFGGDIRCNSEKGRYTTFLLEFPQQRQAA